MSLIDYFDNSFDQAVVYIFFFNKTIRILSTYAEPAAQGKNSNVNPSFSYLATFCSAHNAVRDCKAAAWVPTYAADLKSAATWGPARPSCAAAKTWYL